MKKIILFIMVLILGLTGCGIIEKQDSDLSKEVFNEDSNNEDTNVETPSVDINKLNNDLAEKEKEIEDLNNKIVTLTKKNLDLEERNNEYIEKIEEAEDAFNKFKEQLNHYPEFVTESGEIEDINNYLRELNISFLKTNKELDVLYSNSKDRVIFTTTNFINYVKSIYIWDKGSKEPVLVPNSQFSNGNYKWLEEDKYIIIDSGKAAIRNKKIIDVNKKEIISEFSCISGEYYIPDTTYFILSIPNEQNNEDRFTRNVGIYNFATNELKIIEGDDNKDCNFNIDKINNKVIIEITYEEDKISYYSKKIIEMEDFIEKYCNQAEIKKQLNQETSDEKENQTNEESDTESLDKPNEEVEETTTEEMIEETEEIENEKKEDSSEDNKEEIIDTEQEEIRKEDNIVENEIEDNNTENQ